MGATANNSGQARAVRALCDVAIPWQTVRKSILKRAEQMETEQMFKDAGLTWPIIIPAEEVQQMQAEKAARHQKRL